MRGLRRGRVGVALALAVLVSGVGASWSAADDPVYGMLEAIDPLVGSDWATPLDDPEVMQAAADGATVTDETCTFGGRPGLPGAQIFARPIQTTGHLVVTPSGNVSFVCHAAANARSFQRPLPTQAVVLDGAPCFLPGGRRTNDSQLVVTPSLHVHLVCHFHPPAEAPDLS
jgi:hypothetical protein